MLADEDGAVDLRTRDVGQAMREAAVTATVLEPLYHASAETRLDAARRVDAYVADLLSSVPPGATVVVAGTSDGAATRMHLHVLLVHGPGWRHVALKSPSTRAPYVQLRDVAPTILSVLGVPVPDVMVGRPATMTDVAVKSASAYADDDDHAVTARDMGRRVRAVIAELGMAVVLLLLASRWRPEARRLAAWLACLGVGIPVASFVVQVLPWWRWGSWAYAGLVAAVTLLLAGVTATLVRRDVVAGVLAVPAVTAVALVVDQIAGAPLQLSAPLGDNPIVAGRFHGMGNTDFALMCTSIVLCAALCGGRLVATGRRALGISFAAALLVLAIVVDAAPQLGDDFGGVLTMGPVTAVLLGGLLGIRLTWQRMVALILGAAALAVGVAFADYARPAADQTHVGRFVGQVLHGGAGRVVHRKFDASLGSFGNVANTSFVAVLALAALLSRQRVVPALRRVPGLLPATVAVAVLAVLGTLLNDSGVVVGVAALYLALCAVAAAAPGLPADTS